MEKNSKIYIAGHRGMVGSAIHRRLKKEGFENFVFRTSDELDLRDQQAVADFFKKEKPDYVFLAAAKVGGILANNTYRAEFLYDNLMIQSNVIENSYRQGVKKLLFRFIMHLSKTSATTIERRLSAYRFIGAHK
jgi:GDP-L-fucose synthase